MVRSLQLDIRPSEAELITATVAHWEYWAQLAIAQRGYFTVALSGGGSPKKLYAALVQANIDWSKTWIYWGDERYVPADHLDSNYLMAKMALIDHIAIPAAQVVRMPTEAGDPAADAANYEALLRQQFAGEWPEFDVNFLGVGTDGHTASLFPGTAALKATDWVTVGNKDGQPRLTLSLRAINHSQRAVFYVVGAGKAEIMQTLLCTEAGLPAQQVQPTGDLIWLLDRDAAANLPLQMSV